MTGLFDRITLLKKPEVLDVDKLADETSVEVQEGAKEVNNDVEIVPSPMLPSQKEAYVDLGETDDIQFGGEKTPTDAILEMAGDGTDFAVKGVVRSPNAFTAAQVQANYNESLGFGSVADILRKCCEWQYKHNSSDKGERAKLIFGALGTAKQEEFQLEKETKGLLGNK